MTKFKVGDEVKILNKSIGVASRSSDYGKTAIINHIHGNGSGIDIDNCIEVIGSPYGCFFHPLDLKIVNNKNNMNTLGRKVYVSNNKRTTKEL